MRDVSNYRSFEICSPAKQFTHLFGPAYRISSETEFVSHTFHGGDVILADLFAHLADVYINSPGDNINISSPYVVQKIFTAENLVWILCEIIKQFKFFFG